MPVKWIRKSHRWLGLIIGVQLLMWTASGLYFSWNPIEQVRGEHLVAETPALNVADTSLAGPGAALAALHQRHVDVVVDDVTLRPLMGEPVYEIAFRAEGARRYALADARTGRLRDPLTEDEAVTLARADVAPDVPVASVERVEEAGEGAEYRGRMLPLYRVTFDHPSGARLYVSPQRGRVVARRTDTWRAFDFLWALHIMDYDARDDFNHLLLQAFSVFGLVTVLSGFVLAAVTSPWLRGRRRGRRRGEPRVRRGTRKAAGPRV